MGWRWKLLSVQPLLYHKFVKKKKKKKKKQQIVKLRVHSLDMVHGYIFFIFNSMLILPLILLGGPVIRTCLFYFQAQVQSLVRESRSYKLFSKAKKKKKRPKFENWKISYKMLIFRLCWRSDNTAFLHGREQLPRGGFHPSRLTQFRPSLVIPV